MLAHCRINHMTRKRVREKEKVRHRTKWKKTVKRLFITITKFTIDHLHSWHPRQHIHITWIPLTSFVASPLSFSFLSSVDSSFSSSSSVHLVVVVFSFCCLTMTTAACKVHQSTFCRLLTHTAHTLTSKFLMVFTIWHWLHLCMCIYLTFDRRCCCCWCCRIERG